MFTIRKANDRGHANHGWLDTYHTFSFSNYYDERFMGFRSLRVMNDDRVAPGEGFGMHPHRDMEIVTYVLEGALEHKDSMGNGEVLHPGEVQRITAGSGIRHSEFNPSSSEPVHLYQIWIEPDRKGHVPSYDQRAFPAEGREGKWQLIVSPNGADGSIAINQQAFVYLNTLAAGQSSEFGQLPYGWLQVLRGTADVNGNRVSTGDGIAITSESKLEINAADSGVEVMLFQLA
jgi:redox-sensitive bicupin YhaK (pirin superfamily)